MRPRPARWFELLVARDDTTLALEALAATGAVELEARSGAALPPSYADLRPLLQQFAELAQRYRAWWPREGLRPSAFPEPPGVALQRCIDRLRSWAAEAEPLVRRLQRAQAERAPLEHWRAVFEHLGGGAIDFGEVATAGPQLQVRLAIFPAGKAVVLPAGSDAVLAREFDHDGAHVVLALGTPAQQQALAQEVLAARGQVLVPPAWLRADRAGNDAEARRRLDALDAEAAALRATLAALADRHPLREALADAERLQWVLENVRALESGALFTWVTGWTSASSLQTLERAVERSGARALLRFPPPPAGLRAPMLLANPAWARPFEIFARALGMPSGTEADPSVVLAVAVPLMFGYMFGDLGQGLVIAAAGYALRRRFAIARLFIAGGLSAAFFGLLFGSVFSLHVLPAWWIQPLDDPLRVLVVPLVGGATLLSVGLLLAAVEAHWRGELARWLSTDAGLVIAYLGVLASAAAPQALAAAGAGALLFCLGHAWQARRWSAAASALGELLERLLQLLINTLSFARVGAFALAHAGLGSAAFALMLAAGHPLAAAVVLVLSNVVVMLLEGLVVSIQTTRLVLFEFFARFLEGQGRVFRPLPPPPSTLQES
jgi:V/A-type H+-transporting ATPase subunit I